MKAPCISQGSKEKEQFRRSYILGIGSKNQLSVGYDKSERYRTGQKARNSDRIPVLQS